jgi:hypothetical protein
MAEESRFQIETKSLHGLTQTESEGSKLRPSAGVLGMPPRYHHLADPNGRVFMKTFASDVFGVTFVPGTPRFNKTIATSENQGQAEKEILKKLLKLESRDNQSNDPEAFRDILESNFFSAKPTQLNPEGGEGSARYAKTTADFRYYTFQPSYALYYDHVQLMISYLAVQMGLGKAWYVDFGKEYDAVYDEVGAGIKFYVDKDSGVSEQITNSYGDSMLGGLAKGASKAVTEAMFLLGINKSSDDLTGLAQGKQGAAESLNSQLGESGSGLLSAVSGFLKNVAGTGGRAPWETIASGSAILYPEIWGSSGLTRDYKITINLWSPYGEPESVFNEVYVPFCALLALSAPRQNTLSGYGPPFILRMDVPGRFSSDMCVVTSISFRKGGQDNSNWTVNGFPTAIEVELTIKDLYPMMMITNQYSFLTTNIGLATYLQNMAGLQLMKPNLKSALMAAGTSHWLYQLGNIGSRAWGEAPAAVYKVIEGWTDTLRVARRFFGG